MKKAVKLEIRIAYIVILSIVYFGQSIMMQEWLPALMRVGIILGILAICILCSHNLEKKSIHVKKNMLAIFLFQIICIIESCVINGIHRILDVWMILML